MRCATMIVVCAKAMTTSRKCPTFSSAAASALIGYHTPRQFSFFSFLSFLLFPYDYCYRDEKLHRNLMRVWGEGNVIRNTLTPLHS